mgnify:CR=1 FL=1
MRIEDIRELINLGFTTDQIVTLRGDHAEVIKEQPEQKEQPGQEEQEQEETEPAEQEVNPQIQELQNQINDQKKTIDQLTKMVQNQNLKTARIDSMPDDLTKQTDKIMAELIRPTIKEEK